MWVVMCFEQVSGTWKVQSCGDGVCDLPFEFPAYGDLGCQADCGSELDLHPIVVVLQGDFSHSPLGSSQGTNLMSSVSWNLCRVDQDRTDAGLPDMCYYPEDESLPSVVVAQTFKFQLPAGEWYLRIVGDYYRLLKGRVLDARNDTKLSDLNLSPEWLSCEVRSCCI